MVNRQCDSCFKVCNQILEICPNCKGNTNLRGWAQPHKFEPPFPRREDHSIILTSTPSGRNGFFYDQVEREYRDTFTKEYECEFLDADSLPPACKHSYKIKPLTQSLTSTIERIEIAERELRLAKEQLTNEDSIRSHLLNAFSFYTNVTVEKGFNKLYTVKLDKYDSDGIGVGNKFKEILDAINHIPIGFNSHGDRFEIRFKEPY